MRKLFIFLVLFVLTAAESVQKFLLENLPDADADILHGDDVIKKEELVTILDDTILSSELARINFRWTWGLPEVVFLNEVTSYRSLTEPKFNSRRLFLNILSSCAHDSKLMFEECMINLDLNKAKMSSLMREPVSNMQIVDLASKLPCNTLRSCALWVSQISFKITKPAIHFVAAKPNEFNRYSVKDVILSKGSSCTGMALFLVEFLRAAGVPARVAGVPHWNWPKIDPDWQKKSGNHNWVEVFLEDGWHFIDQTQAVVKFDSGWFFPKWTNLQNFRDGLHSIYATSYVQPRKISYSAKQAYYHKNYVSDYFPMAWNLSDSEVHSWDVTPFYVERR